MIFFVGLHQPSDAKHFERCFLSVNRMRDRKADIGCDNWLMDSGAFTEIQKYGRFREEPAEYAAQVKRWRGRGLARAVSQDYMCEPFITEKTGMTVKQHQDLTIERYDELYNLCGNIIMPVIQGYEPQRIRKPRFGLW